MPATAIITLARCSVPIWSRRRWIPATPTSKTRSTPQPINSAVSAASVATGRSAVPAQSTRTPGIVTRLSRRSTITVLAKSLYEASGATARMAEYISWLARVTSRTSDCWSIVPAMEAA